MGWGVFVAGQVAGSVRRAGNKAKGPDDGMEVLYWLNGKFFESYVKRLLSKTVLIHPDIENKVDWDIWEEEIEKKIVYNWRVLVVIQLISGAICAVGFLPLIFINNPFFWYFGKNKLIGTHADEINKEFESNGYDVSKLLAEMPGLLTENYAVEQTEIQTEAQLAKLDRERRKFGTA